MPVSFTCSFLALLLLIVGCICLPTDAHIPYDAVLIDKADLDRIYEYSLRIAEQFVQSQLFGDGVDQPTTHHRDVLSTTTEGDGTCYSELKPEPEEAFTCSHGELVATSSLITADVKIPRAQVLFRNNLEISNSLTLEGQKSKIEVDGCFLVDSSLKLSIIFTTFDIDQFRYLYSDEHRTLNIIQQKGPNCAAIPELEISVQESPPSCKKLSVEVIQDANSVSARIKVNYAKCMVGSWIVPVIVLVFVIVALVVLLVLRRKVFRRN